MNAHIVPVLALARRQSGDHAADLAPPEATLPADRAKEGQLAGIPHRATVLGWTLNAAATRRGVRTSLSS
jgi:hypothetical protein